MGEPTVTLGVPVYNGERYLEETLASLLSQDFEDIEVLISDNGSNDRTEEICRKAVASDERVRYLDSNENRGAAWNLNRLVREARAPLFKWAYYDDICRPSLVRRCVEALEAAGEDAVLAFPRVALIDQNGQEIDAYGDADLVLDGVDPADRLRQLLTRLADQAQFGVVRTAVLRRTRGVGMSMASDVIILAEMILQGGFVLVPEQLLLLRRHPEQHGGNRDSEISWFDPHGVTRQWFPYISVNGRLLTAVAGADLSRRDKVRCMQVVGRDWILPTWRSSASDLRHLLHLPHPNPQ